MRRETLSTILSENSGVFGTHRGESYEGKRGNLGTTNEGVHGLVSRWREERDDSRTFVFCFCVCTRSKSAIVVGTGTTKKVPCTRVGPQLRVILRGVQRTHLLY